MVGLGTAIWNYDKTWVAICNHYSALSQTPEGQGEIGFELAMLITPMGLAKLERLGVANQAACLARAGLVAGGETSLASRLMSALFGGCFSEGTLVVTPSKEDAAATASQTTVAASTRTIETVALGSRVLGENPRPWEVDTEFPEPDSESWVRITADVRRSDGAAVEAQFLRPRLWVEAARISAGKRLRLSLPELKISGEATIGSVSPSPPIESGGGHVVTARYVSRDVNNLVNLALSDGTAIEVTDIHLIWSADRKGWIPAGQLQPGETLDGLLGPVRVECVSLADPAPAVYNLEVHGQHVYRVAAPGVLVHNNPCPGKLNLNKDIAVSRFGVYEIHVNGYIFKVGKADLVRVVKSSGYPRRIHDQLRRLKRIFGENNVKVVAINDLGETTTAAAKKVEDARILEIFKEIGFAPLGNWRSFPS